MKKKVILKYEVDGREKSPPVDIADKIVSMGHDGTGARCVWVLQYPFPEEKTQMQTLTVAPTGAPVIAPGDTVLGTIFELPYVWHVVLKAKLAKEVARG